jgi:predicted outer membrane repeat protein
MHRKSLLLTCTLAALATSGVISSTALACEVENTRSPHVRFATLTEAVQKATAGDTLKVKGTCEGDIMIGENLSITVSGKAATLKGSGNSSVVSVSKSVAVTLKGLTITGGIGTVGIPSGTNTSGGGIDNEGSLTLNHVTITGNRATAFGGGIYSNGSLTLQKSTVSSNNNNHAGYEGSGIYSQGSLRVAKSTVANNAVGEGHGAGIFIAGGAAVVEHSSVTGNTLSLGNAGGICLAGGSLILSKSTVSDNAAFSGGGIVNGGLLTLEKSTVSNNPEGGGIANGGSLTLNKSTVTGNTGYEGGGIYNGEQASVKLNGSTITLNTATEKGGGIYNAKEAAVTFSGSSSVTNNSAHEHEESGGGIYDEPGAKLIYEAGWKGKITGNLPDNIFPEEP